MLELLEVGQAPDSSSLIRRIMMIGRSDETAFFEVRSTFFGFTVANVVYIVGFFFYGKVRRLTNEQRASIADYFRLCIQGSENYLHNLYIRIEERRLRDIF
ncbi:hypothetical protein LINPERHAP1_LOCUS7341 [Linum perenne]